VNSCEVKETQNFISLPLHLRVEEMLDILKVGHVATGAEDGKVGNLVQSLHITETSQGSIRGQVIGRHHDTTLELDSQH